MNQKHSYSVMLFQAVSYVLKAEKILKAEGIPHKIIPVPKHISSDCGVCVRFAPELREQIEAALLKKVEIEEIRKLGEQ